MTELKYALEAVLFAAGESIPTARLSLIFAVDEAEILQAADELEKEGKSDRWVSSYAVAREIPSSFPISSTVITIRGGDGDGAAAASVCTGE